MKTSHRIATVLLLCLGMQTVSYGLTVPSGYQIEPWVSYDGTPGPSRGMVFDSEGNLYLTSGQTGSIVKITKDRQVNTSWVTGLGNPGGIEFTGGTSYGNNLFVACYDTGKVVKIDMNGNQSNFCSLAGASAVQYDWTGQYGSKLYVGTSLSDRIYSLSETGSSQIFSNSFYNYSGNIFNLAFADSAAYGHTMYAATYYPNNLSKSGLIKISTDGTITRICPDLAFGYAIEYDSVGLFNGDLFASAYPMTPNAPWDSDIYHISSDGTASMFVQSGGTALHGLSFGPDGAMYFICSTSNETSIWRATPIPEPATILIVGMGFLGLRRRI